MKQRLPNETDSQPVCDYPATVTPGAAWEGISEDAEWIGLPTERPVWEIHFNNSNTVDWDHFARLTYLNPRDGVLYMCGLNPAVHKSGAEVGIHITRPSVLIDTNAIAFFAEVQKLIDQVESERRDDWTAGALLQWADQHPDMRPWVHSKFRSIASSTSLLFPSAAPLGDLMQSTRSIPGQLPRRAMGKVAIEVAWQLEVVLQRRAEAKEIMTSLKEMADNGKKPELLKESGKDGRSVVWITDKGAPTTYSLQALKKTLEMWHKSRR